MQWQTYFKYWVLFTFKLERIFSWRERWVGPLGILGPRVHGHLIMHRLPELKKDTLLLIFRFPHHQNEESDSLSLSSLPSQTFKDFYHILFFYKQQYKLFHFKECLHAYNGVTLLHSQDWNSAVNQLHFN